MRNLLRVLFILLFIPFVILATPIMVLKALQGKKGSIYFKFGTDLKG